MLLAFFLSPAKALCLHTSINALKSRRETHYSLYLPPTQHFGPRRCTFPSKGSTYTWGTEFIALELFVPKSSISIPLLFKVSWKLARSSWLFFESFAYLPHIFQAYFFHWPDVLMCPMHSPHLSLLSALSQSKMWNDPCFHWHSSVLGFFSPLTKPLMWRKPLIQGSDSQSRFT